MIFENCIKTCRLKKIICLMAFKVARPVCSRLHFDLRKHFTPKPFIFKNVVFCIFLPKEVKKRSDGGQKYSSDSVTSPFKTVHFQIFCKNY